SNRTRRALLLDPQARRSSQRFRQGQWVSRFDFLIFKNSNCFRNLIGPLGRAGGSDDHVLAHSFDRQLYIVGERLTSRNTDFIRSKTSKPPRFDFQKVITGRDILEREGAVVAAKRGQRKIPARMKCHLRARYGCAAWVGYAAGY